MARPIGRTMLGLLAASDPGLLGDKARPIRRTNCQISSVDQRDIEVLTDLTSSIIYNLLNVIGLWTTRLSRFRYHVEVGVRRGEGSGIQDRGRRGIRASIHAQHLHRQPMS